MKQFLLLFIALFAYSFELKYKSFISDFNQTVQSDNKIISYQGKIEIKNNLVFWHYLKPIEKKIWATNKKIYVYEPDLEQVTIFEKNQQDNLFELLKTAKQIKNNLYLKKYGNKNIYFEIKNSMVKKIYYKDKIDNLVTLNFFNIQKKDLNKSIFIPTYPDYVDIIFSKKL